MNNAAAQRTVRLEPALRAIADMTRLKILLMLEGRERTVNEIVSFFGLAQPTITRHLQTLTAAGLLSRRKEGARVFYGTHVLKVGSVCMDLAKCFPCCCVAVEATPKNSTTRPRSRKSSKPAARKTAKKATKKISKSAPQKPTAPVKRRATKPRARKSTKTQTRRSR